MAKNQRADAQRIKKGLKQPSKEKEEVDQDDDDDEKVDSEKEDSDSDVGDDDDVELDDGNDSLDHNEEDEDEFDEDHAGSQQQSSREPQDEAGNNDAASKKQRKVHKLSLTTTEDFNEKLRKRGVLYVARIPPRMTPTKLKSLLTEFGVVTRVYLMEEDVTVRKRRRKVGGSGSKRYVEGWVEMEDKRVAKQVAASLNNTPITNYKRSVHYGDLWNIKYLNKFKWSHLTEKVAYERRVREQKLRVEMMQARRENAAYAQLVETGQKIDKIEARLERKRHQTNKSPDERGPSAGKSMNTSKGGDGPVKKKPRTHHQSKPLDEGTGKAAKHAVLTSLL